MTESTAARTTTATPPRAQPMLPPLFFSQCLPSPIAHQPQVPIISGSNDDDGIVTIPSELLHQCLLEYAGWGDLAKLACVQKGWSQIMIDAANRGGRQSKWGLCQALLKGEEGLQQNFDLAFRLLSELANVQVDENNNNMPIIVATTDSISGSGSTTTPSHDCFAPAMKELAKCYFEGHGIEKNAEAGVAWLQAAYEMADDSDAAHDLAMVYEYGRYGVEIDIFAAARWLTKAATDGHIEAMAELGLCYELGCGVEQSDTDALDWYMKAANAGHVTSKFSVAECFEEARGVPQSDEEACLWYYKAALCGDHDSKMALRRLEEIARIVVPGVRAILEDV